MRTGRPASRVSAIWILGECLAFICLMTRIIIQAVDRGAAKREITDRRGRDEAAVAEYELDVRVEELVAAGQIMGTASTTGSGVSWRLVGGGFPNPDLTCRLNEMVRDGRLVEVGFSGHRTPKANGSQPWNVYGSPPG